MLHPSYSDLMKVVNSEVEPGEAPVVNSRYSIVMATSKRARQIISGEEPMVDGRGKKPLSVAVEELNQGRIKILSEEEAAKKAEESKMNVEEGVEKETEINAEAANGINADAMPETNTEINEEAAVEAQPEDC
ncbi:MAG: DNA-directed RNA polymerase subunit omega [Kineothrix sp.]|nr:DNA-directed RNA polymerase subunit omega [Kineothrix sp.]NBI90512.1 DNA-directed RNA polymerase subunit omega [Lachnospiraceae bacterium]